MRNYDLEVPISKNSESLEKDDSSDVLTTEEISSIEETSSEE